MTNNFSLMTILLSSTLVFASFAACSGSHTSSPVVPDIDHQAKSRHPDATATSTPGTLYVRGTTQLIESAGNTKITVPAGTSVGDCLVDNHVQVGGTFAAPSGWGTLAGPTPSSPPPYSTSDAVYGHIVVAGDPTSYSWTSASGNATAIDMMYDVVGCKSAPAAFVSASGTVTPGAPNGGSLESAYYQELNAELGIVFFAQLIGTGSNPAYKSPSVLPTGYTLNTQSVGMGGSVDGLSMFGTSQTSPQIQIAGYSGTYQTAGVVLSSATAAPTASPLAYLAISAGNLSPEGNYRYDYTNPQNVDPSAGPTGGPVKTTAVSTTINLSGVSNPAPQAVYQHYVSSMGTLPFVYDIPGLQPNTAYPVRLHFAETQYTQPNSRTFNVSNAGNTLLTNFNPYNAAGGANKAVAATISAVANAQGHLVLAFTPTGSDGAMVNGIEIDPSAAPAMVASTATPTYPVFSSLFTGNTPFHHTVAQLIAAGAVMRSQTVASDLANDGIQSGPPYSPSGAAALYSASVNDPAYIFTCPAYGACADNGATVHCPLVATPAEAGDHHLSCEDPQQGGEVDGWGGYNCTQSTDPVEASNLCPYPCTLTPGQFQAESGSADCAYGNFAPYSGSGLGAGATAGGYAFGLMDVSAQELLNGKINHAMGLIVSCIDDGYYPGSSPSPDGSNPNGVYPGPHGADTVCSGSSSEELPNVVYGDLVTINQNVNVAQLGYGKYCQEIVQALQTYGAYILDSNGGYGLALSLEDPMNPQYPTDPWGTIIFPNMVASGDASDYSAPSGTVDFNLTAGSCLQRLSASQFQVYEISSTLPAQ